eukprot:1541841-Pleurochrysis_carterae.AAC.1
MMNTLRTKSRMITSSTYFARQICETCAATAPACAQQRLGGARCRTSTRKVTPQRMETIRACAASAATESAAASELISFHVP